jgi:hypothetical protein
MRVLGQPRTKIFNLQLSCLFRGNAVRENDVINCTGRDRCVGPESCVLQGRRLLSEELATPGGREWNRLTLYSAWVHSAFDTTEQVRRFGRLSTFTPTLGHFPCRWLLYVAAEETSLANKSSNLLKFPTNYFSFFVEGYLVFKFSRSWMWFFIDTNRVASTSTSYFSNIFGKFQSLVLEVEECN